MNKKILLLSSLFFLGTTLFAENLKDGIYSFDYERVLVSLDVAEMYKAYGINARQDVAKVQTGGAVLVKDNSFVDPESGIIISVGAGGKIKSPDNSSIQGELKHNGKISYYGTYTENNQTIQIVLEGTLVFSPDSDRAGKVFDGTYEANDPGTGKKQIIWIENGLYMWKYAEQEEGDFDGWPMIVKKDGSFFYQSEYTTRAIMYGMNETCVTSKTFINGKFEPDGSISLKILTKNSGTSQQENEIPVNYSAVKASETYKSSNSPVYTALDEKGNKKRRAKSSAIFGADKAEGTPPQWYRESIASAENKIIACAKKCSHDPDTSLKIAEGIALSQIIAYLGTEIQSKADAVINLSDSENQKYLYKTLEKVSLQKNSYEVLEKYTDPSTGWAYVKIQMEKQ